MDNNYILSEREFEIFQSFSIKMKPATKRLLKQNNFI